MLSGGAARQLRVRAAGKVNLRQQGQCSSRPPKVTFVVLTRRLGGELELKRHALGLLKERVASSESAQLAGAIAASEAEAAEAEAAAKAARERKAAMAASAKASSVLSTGMESLGCVLLHAVHKHVGGTCI